MSWPHSTTGRMIGATEMKHSPSSTMMSSELVRLLAEQATHHILDPSKHTSILPVWSPQQNDENTLVTVVDSLVGFIACQTVQSLAKAALPDLLDVFGAVLAGWPGSTSATTVHEARDEDKASVSHFLQETPEADLENKVGNIREISARVRFEVAIDLAEFALHHASNKTGQDLPRIVELFRKSGNT